MRPEAFLFVEPHAGYDPAEAASDTAAPSLSRFELAWERLLRRKYLLGVVRGHLSAAADAHASRKSLCRFLRPGSRADSTGHDGRDVRLQSGYDDVVSDFNDFLRSSLEWFVLGGDAGVDRYWTSGVGSSEVVEREEWLRATGAEPYSRSWTESSDDPQYSMPQVAFRTLAEAWLRTPPRVSRLGVSEGIGPGGDPVVSDRVYTVPRWGSSLPEDDVEGVSSVEVDGVPRSAGGSVSGYGVNDVDGQFTLSYLTYGALRRRQRENAGYCHEYLRDIPPRAPTVYPAPGVAGRADVWPVPSVSVTRYADEGWESADVGRMPPRLVPSVAACFVPPALVPCLRAEFPPPDGWRCGMASEHAGVPYGTASAVRSPLRTLYRATAGCMDAWLSRTSRTATAFDGVLWDFDSRSEWRCDGESRSVYDSTDSSTGPHHSETSSSSWDESCAEAHGSVVAECGANQFGEMDYDSTWVGGFGVYLAAPVASGSATYSMVSRRASSESDDSPPRSSSSVFLDTEERRCAWDMSVYLRNGVPVWRAPWSYEWRTRTASSGQGPHEDSGTNRGTGDEERVLPPEFMPFVRRAEVFVVATAESGSSEPVDYSREEESESHSVGTEARTFVSGSSRRPKTRSSERRLVSLGVLDESGALPPTGLGDLLALCPPDPGGAPQDQFGRAYGDDLTESRTTTVCRTGKDTTVDRWTRWMRSPEPQGYRKVNGNGSYLLLVDWDFDAEHDPFADSELNALWRELAEAGRERAAARASRDAAKTALLKAEAALSAAEADLAALEAELASLDDGGESAGRLAELGAARDAAASALSAAVAARGVAEAEALEAREALEEAGEAEVERLRGEYFAARGAVMGAERAEESARAALASAEAALKRYRDLVDAAEGAREALEAEISEAEGRVSSAEAAVGPAEAAKDAAEAAYGAKDAAYQAILAHIRSAST